MPTSFSSARFLRMMLGSFFPWPRPKLYTSVLLQSGTADAQYIDNKETVGAHFVPARGLSNGATAKTVMG